MTEHAHPPRADAGERPTTAVVSRDASLAAPPAPVRPPGLEPLGSVWAGGVRNPLTLVVLALIRAYQRSLSLAFGPVCRFYPSCSRYGFEAIRVHGVVVGSWLTLRRLGRCNPWNAGGVDLVPARGAREGATMGHDPASPAVGTGPTGSAPTEPAHADTDTASAEAGTVSDGAARATVLPDPALRGARP